MNTRRSMAKRGWNFFHEALRLATSVYVVRLRQWFFEAQIFCVDKFSHRLVINFQPMMFKLRSQAVQSKIAAPNTLQKPLTMGSGIFGLHITTNLRCRCCPRLLVAIKPTDHRRNTQSKTACHRMTAFSRQNKLHRAVPKFHTISFCYACPSPTSKNPESQIN